MSVFFPFSKIENSWFSLFLTTNRFFVWLVHLYCIIIIKTVISLTHWCLLFIYICISAINNKIINLNLTLENCDSNRILYSHFILLFNKLHFIIIVFYMLFGYILTFNNLYFKYFLLYCRNILYLNIFIL